MDTGCRPLEPQGYRKSTYLSCWLLLRFLWGFFFSGVSRPVMWNTYWCRHLSQYSKHTGSARREIDSPQSLCNPQMRSSYLETSHMLCIWVLAVHRLSSPKYNILRSKPQPQHLSRFFRGPLLRGRPLEKNRFFAAWCAERYASPDSHKPSLAKLS